MPTPLSLLSIGHPYVVRLNRRLAHELARQGQSRWEVTAVAPAYFHGGRDLRPVAYQPWQAGEEPCTVEVVPARLTRWVHAFHYGGRLRRILHGAWDLVHAWEEPYVFAGAQIAKWTPRQIPLVFRTAQNLVKRYPPPFNWVERYAMTRAAGWSCCGHTVADALGTRELYRRRPMRVIPLGVDIEKFRPDPGAREEVRRSLGWEDAGPPVVGFLGRFTEAKGVRVLTEALDSVSASGGVWRAMFVGEGRMEPDLLGWSQRYPNRVRVCTGVSHEDVPRYLNAMDVLAAPSLTTPSWREQFGRMLIEAFACGAPVIGSNSGEIPHVIGDAGVVVAEGDVAAWARELETLLESPRRRTELASRGLERARERYAWQVVARQYVQFFDDIVQTRQRPDGRP